MILQRPQATASLTAGRDVDWTEAMADAEPADCVPVAATDPLYILYTSGTTARPKGVVRDNGGHAVALRWSMPNIYDTGPGDVFWAASDVGWVVGHSYIVYAPLLAGCTTVLYEGKPVGTPDAGAFWRVVAEHKVKALFTAPTAFRAIKKEDPEGKLAREHDLSGLSYLFLAGERLDPETYRWAGELLGIPVIDHWWQTETGWPIAANPMGLEAAADQGRVADRADARLRRARRRRRRAPRPAGRTGEIVVRLPLPPGCLPTLVARRRAVRRLLPVRASGLLPHRRRRPPRRGRLPVRDGPDRRRDQRGRAPAVHRGDGGGAGQPSGGGRVRGDRGQRRVQGPGAARVRGAQGGRQRRPGRAVRRARPAGPRPDRAGGGAAPGRRRGRRCPRPARARSCARPCAASPTARRTGAVHHRGPGRAGRAAPRPVRGL